MIVTAIYSDGSSKAVSGYTTNPADGAALNNVGTQTVTVSYTEDGVTKTTSFAVAIETEQVIYEVITSFGTYKGNGDCTAEIDANRDDFIQLLLDGKVVDPSNYTVTSGSTIITLKESYLKILDNGTHIFRAEFMDGYADITLLVNTTNTQNEEDPSDDSTGNPNTGDDGYIWLHITMLALASITGTMILYKKKKEKKNA